MNSYHFEDFDLVPPEYSDVLLKGINEEALACKKTQLITPFGIFIKDSAGAICAGVQGFSYYQCLYVDLLWVASNLRHQGYGSELMLKAESLGKKRGCTFSTVSTMDWEALPLYLKLNYSIEFTRTGYEQDSKLFFLRKAL